MAGATQPYAGAPVARVRDVVGGVDLDAPLGDTGSALAELRAVYLEDSAALLGIAVNTNAISTVRNQ